MGTEKGTNTFAKARIYFFTKLLLAAKCSLSCGGKTRHSPCIEKWGCCKVGQIHLHKRLNVKRKCLYGEKYKHHNKTNPSPRGFSVKLYCYISTRDPVPLHLLLFRAGGRKPTDYLGLSFSAGQDPPSSSRSLMPWEADCGHLSHTPWHFPPKVWAVGGQHATCWKLLKLPDHTTSLL